MLTADLCYHLPDGDLISYKEILSPFSIYRLQSDNNETFVLIPKEGQDGLQNTIFLADENGVRKCDQNYDVLQRVPVSNIPQDMLIKVCEFLVNTISSIVR